jgi:hypothetical protein
METILSLVKLGLVDQKIPWNNNMFQVTQDIFHKFKVKISMVRAIQKSPLRPSTEIMMLVLITQMQLDLQLKLWLNLIKVTSENWTMKWTQQKWKILTMHIISMTQNSKA